MPQDTLQDIVAYGIVILFFAGILAPTVVHRFKADEPEDYDDSE